MEILGVYNIKGGVGKTTTAVNLAFRSAAEGWRTLLWDLDPQGAASYILRRQSSGRVSAKDLVRGKAGTPVLIQATDYPDLGLLPSDFSYRRLEHHLEEQKKPAKQLLKLMAPLHREYACLIMDCAPGMSIVSENVLHAADALIVPLTPSPLSVRTLRQLFEFLEKKQWTDLSVLPFFSMIDRRRRLHRETAEALRAEFPEILDTEVPYGTDFEQIAVRRAPGAVFAASSAASQTYRALWQEIDARLAQRAGRPRRP
jgi:chromosome partitioning protein